MIYLFGFLEGLASFISPCILPMLPLYLSYFSGSIQPEERSLRRTVANVSAFILGFAFVLMSLGALSGLVGSALIYRFQTSRWLGIVTGLIVTLFGLSYMGLFQLPFLSRLTGPQMDPQRLKRLNVASSFVFGMIFTLAWSPCLGVFLGAAFNLAATSGTVLQGILIMLFFSLGLGIPFFLSAFLMEQLTSVFAFIKKHYRIVNMVCGGLLVLTGLAMMTGMFASLLRLVTPTS